MAQVRTVTCDRCKVLIGTSRVLLIVKAGRLPRLTYGKGVDLCQKCGKLFDEWLGPNLPEHLTSEADAEENDAFS
jgi:hypothetical protein